MKTPQTQWCTDIRQSYAYMRSRLMLKRDSRIKGGKKQNSESESDEPNERGVQIPHVASPSPFLAYHLSLDHGGVVMSTGPQVTMTTAQGEALAREVIASLGM